MNVHHAMLVMPIVHAVRTQIVTTPSELTRVPALLDSLGTVKLALISMNAKQIMADAML